MQIFGGLFLTISSELAIALNYQIDRDFASNFSNYHNLYYQSERPESAETLHVSRAPAPCHLLFSCWPSCLVTERHWDQGTSQRARGVSPFSVTRCCDDADPPPGAKPQVYWASIKAEQRRQGLLQGDPFGAGSEAAITASARLTIFPILLHLASSYWRLLPPAGALWNVSTPPRA